MNACVYVSAVTPSSTHTPLMEEMNQDIIVAIVVPIVLVMIIIIIIFIVIIGVYTCMKQKKKQGW